MTHTHTKLKILKAALESTCFKDWQTISDFKIWPCHWLFHLMILCIFITARAWESVRETKIFWKSESREKLSFSLTVSVWWTAARQLLSVLSVSRDYFMFLLLINVVQHLFYMKIARNAESQWMSTSEHHLYSFKLMHQLHTYSTCGEHFFDEKQN